MTASILNFYSEKPGEIKKFLNLYFANDDDLEEDLFWKKTYENPMDMIDLIICFIDNSDNFDIKLWISLDKNIFICINEKNLDSIIRYMYERYPW